MRNPYPPGELHVDLSMWTPCGLYVDWRWTGDGLDVDLGSITWLMFVEMSLLPVLWLSLSNPYPVLVEYMWSPDSPCRLQEDPWVSVRHSYWYG